jgi:hypothetical protein
MLPGGERRQFLMPGIGRSLLEPTFGLDFTRTYVLNAALGLPLQRNDRSFAINRPCLRFSSARPGSGSERCDRSNSCSRGKTSRWRRSYWYWRRSYNESERKREHQHHCGPRRSAESQEQVLAVHRANGFHKIRKEKSFWMTGAFNLLLHVPSPGTRHTISTDANPQSFECQSDLKSRFTSLVKDLRRLCGEMTMRHAAVKSEESGVA